PGRADPRASLPLPPGGSACPVSATERDGKKLLVGLQNDYSMTTHLTMVPLSEVTRVHIRHQSVQGSLVGLLLGTALTALLLGTLRADPLHQLLGLSPALLGLTRLTGVGPARHNSSFLHGQTGNLLSLAGFIVLSAGLHGAMPLPGTTGSRAERIIILVVGSLILSISIAQP